MIRPTAMSLPLARERAVAIAAAHAAGTIVKGYYDGTFEVREKGHDNPVTAADLEADACIKKTVLEAFPSDGWLSEETADSTDRLAKPRVWIVDPLDGTKEFTQHIPEFCICIALVEHGRPIVAVSYNPAAERLYCAVKGQGTTCNETPVRVSTQSALREALARVGGLLGEPAVVRECLRDVAADALVGLEVGARQRMIRPLLGDRDGHRVPAADDVSRLARGADGDVALSLQHAHGRLLGPPSGPYTCASRYSRTRARMSSSRRS